MNYSGKTYKKPTAISSDPVVLYRSEASSDKSKISKFISAVMLIASISVTSLQAGFVLNANAAGNPISSPISTQESPAPTASPKLCPDGYTVVQVINGGAVCKVENQEQNNQNQNVTATGGSSSSSSSNVITSPETSPTPSPSASVPPVTSPEVTPTPTPTPAPYVNIISPNGGETFNVGDTATIAWDYDNVTHCVVSYHTETVSSQAFYPVNPIQAIYDWTVNVEGLAQGDSAQVKIDISCYDENENGAADSSNEYFTVINPVASPSAEPSVEPSPSPSVEPSPSMSPEPSVSPSPSAEPSVSPSPSVTPLPSEEPEATESAEPTASPTPEPSAEPDTNEDTGSSVPNDSGSSSSSSSSSSAPSCDTQAPSSAPKIVSAVTTGSNQVTLTWDKAGDPVSYYLVAYGLEAGKPIYGNPNIGNTTTFTVKGLSGSVTYYFKVRAGNGCKPGEFSTEIPVKVGGQFILGPAENFKAGVLSATTEAEVEAVPTPEPSISPIAESIQSGGLIGKIINFFKSFFN